jgi:hypothetical protein
VAPSKSDRKPWDGFGGDVSQDIADAVATALAGPAPYRDVIEVLTGSLLSAYDKPEPFGHADISLDGAFLQEYRVYLEGQKDTLVPQWDGPPGWLDAALLEGTRVRVSLEDQDISNDDPIGVVELNAFDFVDAWWARQTYPVDVSDQPGQLLFVTISVTAASP